MRILVAILLALGQLGGHQRRPRRVARALLRRRGE
jgi:hypothetical protein